MESAFLLGFTAGMVGFFTGIGTARLTLRRKLPTWIVVLGLFGFVTVHRLGLLGAGERWFEPGVIGWIFAYMGEILRVRAGDLLVFPVRARSRR